MKGSNGPLEVLMGLHIHGTISQPRPWSWFAYRWATHLSELIDQLCATLFLHCAGLSSLLIKQQHTGYSHRMNQSLSQHMVVIKFFQEIMNDILVQNYNTTKCVKFNFKGQRNGSMFESTDDCFRGPGFKSKHPNGGTKPSIILVSGDPIPSSGLYGHCT